MKYYSMLDEFRARDDCIVQAKDIEGWLACDPSLTHLQRHRLKLAITRLYIRAYPEVIRSE